MSGVRESGHVFVPVGLFGGIAFVIAADLASDYHAGHWPLHFGLEVLAGGLAIVGVGLFARHAWTVHTAADDLERDLRAKEREAQQWRQEARQRPRRPRRRDRPGVREVEPHRGGARRRAPAPEGPQPQGDRLRRHTGEGTVRQQALAIYRKAGLTGRSNLAAFFLEGLSLPRHSANARVAAARLGRQEGPEALLAVRTGRSSAKLYFGTWVR